MSAVFIKLLNMSITASWLILTVIFVRLLLKKAPKWITCLLWGLVAVRLVCPFSFESVFSLVPSSQTIPSNIALQQEPAIHSGIPIVNETINPILSESFTPAPENSVNPLQIVIPIASIIWVAGIVIMLAYAFTSYLKLKKTVSACVPVKKGVLSCDEVKTPFILGVFRPVIYVPSSLQEETLCHVIRHETAHLQRHDHWWKPLGFLLLSIYWFHPLCWIAYVLLCRDIEMACDEKVIRDMDKDEIAGYSQALLDCSYPRRRIAACPVAFGEVGVKERVKGVLNYKKPAFWIILMAIITCIGLSVCLMTDPKNSFQIHRSEVEKVTYFNMFVGDDCQGELNDAQIDEMVKRISAISKAEKDNRYEGQTPGYQLCVSLKNGSFMYANGYHAVDDMVEIIMNGSRYSVFDSDFAEYLRNVCSGNEVSSIQQIERRPFYLTIGSDGVKSILITTPYSSGGCENADGSLYRKGERIWLEPLDGFADLRGVTITALNASEAVLWTVSVSNTQENIGLTHLMRDGWIITNLRDSTNADFHITYELGDTVMHFTSTPFEAKAGEKVEIRTDILLDKDIHVYVDGKEVDKMKQDSDYWGYSFIMPERDVLVTASFDTKEEGLKTETVDLSALREKYPEYFDLDTFKGLELYVWQMAPGSYSCGLMPGTNRNKTLEELMNLKGTSITEMRLILSTYDMDEKDISIIPWQNPISSYLNEYWINQQDEDPVSVEKRRQEYIDGIRQMLFGTAQAEGHDQLNSTIKVNTAVAYANWTEDSKVLDCLNADKLIISSVRHLLVYKLDTKEDLDRFKENFQDILTFDHGYGEVPSFNDVTALYDDGFFNNHTVVIAYVSATSGSYRYAIHGISQSASSFCLEVAQTNHPETHTDDMAGWFVIAEVLDSDIANITEFDAILK